VVCALWRVKGTNFCLPSVVPELHTKKKGKKEKIGSDPCFISIPCITRKEKEILYQKNIKKTVLTE